MLRIFKTRYFSRWMRKTELSNDDLVDAVSEMARGLIDADLGGGVVKKRIALPGRGKRGGTRTLVGTNKGNRWFFMYGFEKNQISNVGSKELESLQKFAHDLLTLSNNELESAIDDGAIQELNDDKTS